MPHQTGWWVQVSIFHLCFPRPRFSTEYNVVLLHGDDGVFVFTDLPLDKLGVRVLMAPVLVSSFSEVSVEG